MTSISVRKIWAVYLLLAINFIVYAYESIVSGSISNLSMKALIYLAQINYLVLEYGWYWQLFTSMFTHLGLMHILFNMFWLYILGFQLERRFGAMKLIGVYIITGLAGNIASLFLLPPNTLSAGASGAIFGIFGFLILYNGAIGGKVKSMILYGFFIFLINIIFNVNIWAHLFGMVVGMIWGYYEGKNFLRSKEIFIVRRWY